MREIGAFEAKNTLGALLDSVEHGEELVITRHGKAVARLVPYSGGIDRAQARAAGLKPAPFDWEILKADRDAGRP
jgi:prevent-host-death family protein